MTTELLAVPHAVARAVELLATGEPVALPTETVYGLAADALRPDAVLKIFEAKERPFFDPLIVHLPDRGWLERVAAIPAESREMVERLTTQFWPGPLTLVLPRMEGPECEADLQSAIPPARQTASLPHLVTAGLATVAVRMSAHPVFREIIAHFGSPLAAPSANRFGRISPTTAEHVIEGLGGRIPLVVDGGPCAVGLESTIVAVDGERLRILRAGPITPEELAQLGPVEFAAASGRPDAPGQLKSHYAPRTCLLIVHGLGWQRPMPPSAMETGVRRGLLAWRSGAPDRFYDEVEILSPSGDLREAAATFFAKLRRLDAAGLDFIFAEPVPEHGLGLAIMDRLRKAAHE